MDILENRASRLLNSEVFYALEEAQVYFAHPYASWERGLNENTNGLVRQYFPKQRDLITVTEAEIEHTMNRLNHRPRRTLGFRTPYEVFFKARTSLTVALAS